MLNVVEHPHADLLALPLVMLVDFLIEGLGTLVFGVDLPGSEVRSFCLCDGVPWAKAGRDSEVRMHGTPRRRGFMAFPRLQNGRWPPKAFKRERCYHSAITRSRKCGRG
jgi:hypothetical protein